MEYRAADFPYWDTVERFTLTEAAWLWCDLEPPDDGIQHMPILGKGIKPHAVIAGLPAKGQRAARAMWSDIEQGRLIILTEWPDTRYLIPRAYLRPWAETYSDFRPRFLFQDGVKPPKPRISEREAEHERWKTCAEKVKAERKLHGKPPLKKMGLAREVIDRLSLHDSVDTVRRVF